MVYLVEDDTNIRELVLYTLQASGFEAKGFSESGDFFRAVGQQQPEIVLLDIMLPGQDGLSILKQLKSDKKTASLPVIMLTAKNSEFDAVNGLESGADDYITKPFRMMELLSRVRAVLRRSQAPKNTETLLSRGIEMDTQRFTVKVEGEPVKLTLKEFELLRLLLENTGRVFTRDQLLEQVWGYEYQGETRTVDVHVRSLRQKLGAPGGQIETVRGVGYRMEAME